MKIALATALACLTSLSGAAADDGAKQQATDFATKAAMSNLFEIEAAKIELTKGKANDAKHFAQDMLTDHGKAGPLLSDAAKQDGVELNAANLDQAYLSTQVAAHQEAVALFESYSKDGPDGQLKRTAAKILPDLHMHLTRVQGLTSK